MNEQKIKVGIIGLKPDGQWASKSHISALQLLKDDFEIVGVANSTYASSAAAAKAYQIPQAFQNGKDLITSPDIELVVITVKVPHHFDLVKLALEHGKHVYCEHPLGTGLQETRDLAMMATLSGSVAVCGTQMVVSPEVRYLQQLLNEGYIGEVRSTTLIGSGGSWGKETTSDNYYMSDKSQGANMLTIPMGHTLAGLTKVLGPIGPLSAQMLNQVTQVTLTDTQEVKPKTAEDQIMFTGTLVKGGAIVVHYRSGMSRGTNLLWEINGTEGDLQISGPIGHGQLAPLTLRGATGADRELQQLTVPEEFSKGLPANAVVRNVALMYQRIAADIRNDTRTAPSFKDQVILYELLERIQSSAGRS